MLNKERQLLRQSRLPCEAPKHRVKGEKPVKDDQIHNQGRQLPSSSGRELVRSPALSLPGKEEEIDLLLHQDSPDDQTGQRYYRRNRRGGTGLCSPASPASSKILGLPRAQKAPTITCGGPAGGLPCLSCRWAREFLEQGSCIVVEPEYSDSDPEATQAISDVDSSFSSDGEDDLN